MTLEGDGLWTFAGRKRRKVWLVYDCRESGEIAAFVLMTAVICLAALKRLQLFI
jgi:hypothetical protein